MNSLLAGMTADSELRLNAQVSKIGHSLKGQMRNGGINCIDGLWPKAVGYQLVGCARDGTAPAFVGVNHDVNWKEEDQAKKESK